MKEIKTFFIDVVKTFFYFCFSALNSLVYILYSVLDSTTKFIVNVIKPMFIELLADIGFIGLILKQMYFEVARNICLTISRYLLKYADYSHKESEKLIESTWSR